MKILVTNDDGVLAEGLWTLVEELRNIAEVIVVAPDRERSAIGTGVTLRQPLRVRKVKPTVPGVKAYAVEGTPADSVILALGIFAAVGLGAAAATATSWTETGSAKAAPAACDFSCKAGCDRAKDKCFQDCRAKGSSSACFASCEGTQRSCVSGCGC